MKKEFFKFAILLMVALGAAPAYSAMWQWSKTASSNATADPTINYSEGQSPSSLNDSSRAAMARTAEYRDDISGLLQTGGTSAAYTVTTNQGLSATPNYGQLLAAAVHTTNGTGATLSADGGGAFPINMSFGVPAPAGALAANSVYTFRFDTGGGGQWLLRDFYANSLTVPLGALIPYTGTTAPNSNFVFPAGQCLSTATYSAYWALLGSPASGSCAGGQFRIVDLSGRAPVGLDTMPGFSAANRLTSSSTGCGTAMTSVGAFCANGVEGSVIPLAQLPTGITSAGSNNITVISANALIDATGVLLDFNPPSASGFRTVNNTASLRQQTSNGINLIGVTSNNTSGTARPSVPPVVGVTYLLRVI